MMDDEPHHDSAGVWDWMAFVGFLGSVLLGMALPFFLGVVAIHRLIPFGELDSWVYGWRAVLGISGIFLLWFLATCITDRIVDLLIDKRNHPVLHEFAGEALSIFVLFMLMSSLFVSWQAALLCSVVTSILTVLPGLIINKIFDRSGKHQ
jgi:4-hydroxybenzoate polyprenyltransferase